MEAGGTTTAMGLTGPQLFIKDWTAESLLAVVVLLFLFGLILPLRTHKRELEAKDELVGIHEKASIANAEQVKILTETTAIQAETINQLTDEVAANIEKTMGELQANLHEGAGRHE